MQAADTTGGTRTGALGTFLYAAPEALEKGADVDARSDVYGLGMVGVFAYSGRDLPSRVVRDCEGYIAQLPVSSAVKATLSRACAWSAEDRFESVAEMISQLGAQVAKRAVKLSQRGGLAFQWIPAGTFVMGSPEGELGRASDEHQEKRTVAAFYLGDAPVTREQYAAFLDANSDVSEPPKFRKALKEQPRVPVTNVTWEEANRFARSIGGRLPSEAEWEYACRAGTTKATYAGDLTALGLDRQLARIAWYVANTKGAPCRVKLKEPNPYGLYDMLGNVFEWCHSSGAGRQTGPVEGSRPVLKGGAFGSAPASVRAAARHVESAFTRSSTVGFRVAMDENALTSAATLAPKDV